MLVYFKLKSSLQLKYIAIVREQERHGDRLIRLIEIHFSLCSVPAVGYMDEDHAVCLGILKQRNSDFCLEVRALADEQIEMLLEQNLRIIVKIHPQVAGVKQPLIFRRNDIRKCDRLDRGIRNMVGRISGDSKTIIAVNLPGLCDTEGDDILANGQVHCPKPAVQGFLNTLLGQVNNGMLTGLDVFRQDFVKLCDTADMVVVHMGNKDGTKLGIILAGAAEQTLAGRAAVDKVHRIADFIERRGIEPIKGRISVTRTKCGNFHKYDHSFPLRYKVQKGYEIQNCNVAFKKLC